MSRFVYVPHPQITARKGHQPRKVSEHHGLSLNGRLARIITTGVGTMWCAYAFAILALVALPQAIKGGALAMVQWLSQTFIQLVLLSVIMVGQDVMQKASDDRANQTYNDAEAILAEAQQLQAHLAAQDVVIDAIVQHLKVEVPEAQVKGDKIGK